MYIFNVKKWNLTAKKYLEIAGSATVNVGELPKAVASCQKLRHRPEAVAPARSCGELPEAAVNCQKLRWTF